MFIRQSFSESENEIGELACLFQDLWCLQEYCLFKKRQECLSISKEIDKIVNSILCVINNLIKYWINKYSNKVEYLYIN